MLVKELKGLLEGVREDGKVLVFVGRTGAYSGLLYEDLNVTEKGNIVIDVERVVPTEDTDDGTDR